MEKLETRIAGVENGREEVLNMRDLGGKDEKAREIFLQIMTDDLDMAGEALGNLKESVREIRAFFDPYFL